MKQGTENTRKCGRQAIKEVKFIIVKCLVQLGMIHSNNAHFHSWKSVNWIV